MLSIPPAPPFTRNEWFLWITNSFGLFYCFLLWQWGQAESLLNLELNTVIGTCFIALLLYCFVELTLNWYLNLESITATGECFIMWPFCDVNMNCLNLARFLWLKYWINSPRAKYGDPSNNVRYGAVSVVSGRTIMMMPSNSWNSNTLESKLLHCSVQW